MNIVRYFQKLWIESKTIIQNWIMLKKWNSGIENHSWNQRTHNLYLRQSRFRCYQWCFSILIWVFLQCWVMFFLFFLDAMINSPCIPWRFRKIVISINIEKTRFCYSRCTLRTVSFLLIIKSRWCRNYVSIIMKSKWEAMIVKLSGCQYIIYCILIISFYLIQISYLTQNHFGEMQNEVPWKGLYIEIIRWSNTITVWSFRVSESHHEHLSMQPLK